MAPGNDITATTKPAAPGQVAPEDEDLFSFPVIEMVLEDAAKSEGRTVGDIAASTSTTPTVAKAAATPKPAPATAPTAQPKAASAPAPARAPAKPAVEKAAELIDDLEEVLDEEIESSRLARRDARRPVTVAARSSPMAMLGGMLMLNLLTFGFFWYTSQNFRDGLEGLREDLVFATNASRTTSQPAKPSPMEDETEAPVEASATSTAKPIAKLEVAPAPVLPAHPLEAFERTTLDLAREEIAQGEVIAARKRLHRLLAIADRMEPELARDVEARSRFLIAESYRSQAATKELRKREADESDKARAKELMQGSSSEKAKRD